MDLLVIGSQETRNSSKRVRRNGEGKTDLLCSKWFLTRHCLLRTVLTFSHTSWSHYSKVFFVKGKGGKRASRISSERQQKEESRGWQREAPQRRPARQRKGRHRIKRAREEERDTLQREQKEAGTVTQAHFFDASHFLGSSFFFDSHAASRFPKFYKNWKLIKVKNFEILSLSFARNLENWNFEILETRNTQQIKNLQNALILGLRKRQYAHPHVEILLKWKTEN